MTQERWKEIKQQHPTFHLSVPSFTSENKFHLHTISGKHEIKFWNPKIHG